MNTIWERSFRYIPNMELKLRNNIHTHRTDGKRDGVVMHSVNEAYIYVAFGCTH